VPGRIGSGGCRRSSAWMPLCSSVLTVWLPAAWLAGAAAYVAQIVRTAASNPSGSLARLFVSQ